MPYLACFDFPGRLIRSGRANNASDPVNLALNYGYGVLEGECRRAINTVGLEPSIGFLHQSSGSQTKQSLVYDLQEPHRWLADVSVVEAFESGALDLPDFYFTGDDYRYHLDTEAKRRFIEVLRGQFNRGVHWNRRVLRWDTVIEQKTMALAKYLTGKSQLLDFSAPLPDLQRLDNRELRTRILSLSHWEAKKTGISKTTLHYLRKNARASRPFKVYGEVLSRLVGKSPYAADQGYGS